MPGRIPSLVSVMVTLYHRLVTSDRYVVRSMTHDDNRQLDLLDLGQQEFIPEVYSELVN